MQEKLPLIAKNINFGRLNIEVSHNIWKSWEFLTNRKQFILVNGAKSGVPQGKVVFLILINNIDDVARKVFLFADDTRVNRSIKTPKRSV